MNIKAAAALYQPLPIQLTKLHFISQNTELRRESSYQKKSYQMFLVFLLFEFPPKKNSSLNQQNGIWEKHIYPISKMQSNWNCHKKYKNTQFLIETLIFISISVSQKE